MTKPICGAQPRVINGLGFLYVNGCNPDPAINCEHMLLTSSSAIQLTVSEATARFKFSNAANGGKLLMRDGGYRCLGNIDVASFVTNEVFIVTLYDDGYSWYGAFIGDYTLLEREYMPNPESHDPQFYSTIGLLRKSLNGFETLTMTAIPSVRRFATINCNVSLETSSPSGNFLEASFAIQNGGSYTLTAEADAVLAPAGRQAGIIYLVGGGSPCTNLPQREIAVDSFHIQF